MKRMMKHSNVVLTEASKTLRPKQAEHDKIQQEIEVYQVCVHVRVCACSLTHISLSFSSSLSLSLSLSMVLGIASTVSRKRESKE